MFEALDCGGEEDWNWKCQEPTKLCKKNHFANNFFNEAA